MKISIITVTLNSEKTIRDTLNSVISQTYKKIEHIIVDGGSSDNTMKLIREKNFNKIVISKSKIIGIYESFNEQVAKNARNSMKDKVIQMQDYNLIDNPFKNNSGN